MPPAGYLTASGIEACLQFLATTYPSICQLIVMPEHSVEGRTIRAIKLAKGTGADRRAVLLIGGVHAREVVNPDLLVSLALKLCQAYTTNTGLSFGPKSYPASTIKLIIETMDVFFLPLVNPDGRVFVQSPAGDPMWRKNRSLNPGQPCKGVDLNRNYQFLFTSGIGTSSNSCSEVFKGSAAFSEPETRNVRHMLDTYSNICCMADVHSFSELILYSWGDDDNQTTDPAMNFQNAAFDGLRGNPGDSLYKEYIPSGDQNFMAQTGNKVRDAISAVRGRVYTVEQAVLLYPTSGTSKDYAYSRHFVDATKRKVIAYTIETGTEFQPTYAEALNIISEVSAGLIQFCLACLCAAESTFSGTELASELVEMRAFRDEELLRSGAGRRYDQLLSDHGVELVLLLRDERLRKQLFEVTRQTMEVVRSRKSSKPKTFDSKTISNAEKVLRAVSAKASRELKKSIEEVSGDLKYFRGKTLTEGLKGANARTSSKDRR